MKTSQLICTAWIILAVFSGCTSRETKLTVWSRSEPFSADPYEFNAAVHHVVWGPVFIKLFTAYKDARIEPSLVASWASNDQHTRWSFKIRGDVFFSNGDKILPKHVLLSLKRFFLLAKKNNSTNHLLLKLKGADRLHSMNDDVSGLTIDSEGTLVIDLNKPEKNFPETLAFGLYAVIHPNDYDALDGTWKGGLTPIASGPYEVQKNDAAHIILTRRNSYPSDQRANNAFSKIEYKWIDAELKKASDIYDGYGTEQPISGRFEFKGNTNDNVLFLRILGWQNSYEPLSNKLVRASLREAFYNHMLSKGIKVRRSLYPALHVESVESVKPENTLKNKFLSGKSIKFSPPGRLDIPSLLHMRDSLVAAIEEAGGKVITAPKLSMKEFIGLKKIKAGDPIPFHFYGTITTIGNEDPKETTKLMFSPEGVFLPDPGARVKKLMRNESFSINQVNELIFDEAVVWPVLHFSHGFFVNTSKVDLSRYNHQWPLSELQWMGAK